MKSEKYIFPLNIQLGEYEIDNPEFLDILELLKKHEFSGIELNIVDFEKTDAMEYVSLLSKYNLKLTMIATGAYAKKEQLSLSDQNQDRRKCAVEKLKKIIYYASKIRAGVICGFIKGPAGIDKSDAEQEMKKSLAELDDIVREYEVPLLIESTNHYETSVAINLAENVKMIEHFCNPYFRVLPDTYHMNIEEFAMGQYALAKYKDFYQSVHISDNNRCFPGLGAIDFRNPLAVLKGIGYQGSIVIEGNIKNYFENDLMLSAEYLGCLSKQMRLNV